MGNGIVLYDTREAAAMLGVSRDTLRRWVAAGRLRPSKLTRKTWRFDVQDLERLLREGKEAPACAGRPGSVGEAAT